MHWGHKVIGKDGQISVNRADYNAAFGAESPEQPEIPDCVMHIWKWWWGLNARRSTGSESAQPLSYTEIYYWRLLTCTQITKSEIDIIVRMDDAYLQAVNTERKEQFERNRET